MIKVEDITKRNFPACVAFDDEPCADAEVVISIGYRQSSTAVILCREHAKELREKLGRWLACKTPLVAEGRRCPKGTAPMRPGAMDEDAEQCSVCGDDR